MATIHLSDEMYEGPENDALRQKLEDFFNREDVNRKITAVANALFPDGDFKHMQGFSVFIASLYPLLGEKMESGAHTFCASIFDTFNASQKNPALLGISVNEGLKNVADELTALLQKEKTSSLKTNIMRDGKVPTGSKQK